jgi:predicted nucleic acid-binding protein
MIFLDANVPMYLAGGEHPNRTGAEIWVARLARAGERLVTSAEVLQEIVHRYAAIHQRERIAPVLAQTLRLVDDVLPISSIEVLRAAEIVGTAARFSARDALHVATMERHGIERIFTFDRAFALWPGLSVIN